MSATIIRILILILIFGMVFLISEFVLGQMRARNFSVRAINQRLRMIEQGSDRQEVMAQLRKATSEGFGHTRTPIGRALRRLERIVRASGIRMATKQAVLLMFAAVGLVFTAIVIGAAYVGYGVTLGIIELALAFSLSLGLVLPLLFLSQAAQKKRAKMQAQFPIALDIFVRGLKAGHPIASALSLLANDMEDPIGSEFGLVTDEISYGADLREALQDMANRWDLDDMHMFVVCLSVQSETGGNLAEILENLARVIRDRATMYMKVRALSSEGRMSAKVLTALPIGTFALVFMINPGFYLEYSKDPTFIIGFSALIALYLLGAFIIRKMVDLKV
jgi:tight adherence protein B